MIIQHNITALNAYNRLNGNNTIVGKNLEKLSSGYKINRAADDAAGLAISEKMRAQITGLTRATQNAQDGISLVQTAEGQLTEVHSMLNRMVDLATQASNGTYDNDVDRKNLNKELTSLKEEVDRIAETSHFNGIKLLDGSLGTSAATVSMGAIASGGTFGSSTVVSVTGQGVTGAKTFTFAASGASAMTVSVEDAEGNTKVTTLTFADIVKEDDGTAYNNAAGARNTIDLTSVGLGKLTVVNTAASGTIDAFGTAFTTKANGATITSTAVASTGQGLSLQIGDTADQRVTISVGDMGTVALGINGISTATETDATNSIQLIKDAINTVSGTRADLGAVQNRLEHTISNLTATTENMTQAESRIRDTDMAKEMMSFTKNNVLAQAAQAMLAQANQQPQQVLQLLR